MLVAALSLASSWSATAQANPLLSGYGGPGQGSQAILGAQLLGGPQGGGGGPTAGGGAGTSASSSEPSAVAPAGGRNRAPASGKPKAPAPRSSRRRPQSGGRGGAAGALAAGQAASERNADSSDVLGLSSDDLLYVVLAFVALALTGVLTAVLVRRPPRGYGG
jgi:hypothetical protein